MTMTRKEKKEELIGLFSTGAIYLGDLIDECFEFGQQHPQWISVEDELPTCNVFVLTCDGQGNTNLLMLAGNGRWYDKAVWLHRNITHWMPLPSIEHFADVSKKISSSVKPNNCKKFDMKGYENVVIHEGKAKGGILKTIDVDKVIAWLVANICDYEYYVKLFKQDFGL